MASLSRSFAAMLTQQLIRESFPDSGCKATPNPLRRCAQRYYDRLPIAKTSITCIAEKIRCMAAPDMCGASAERLYLAAAEVQRLLNSLPEPCCAVVLVAVLTGMRIGEILALGREHIAATRGWPSGPSFVPKCSPIYCQNGE